MNVKTKMRPIRDPDTGRILEEYPFDDPWGELIQRALNQGLLEYSGSHNAKGRPLYRRTTLGERGPN